jgi:mannose-6-phosphate isomerase-like protein (cupin superfamily)
VAPALVAGVFLAGCGTTDTRIVGQFPGSGALQDWRAIANTNRPQRGEILKIVELGRSEALSNHLAIVQSRELPHRHNRHDATVTILRGNGTMTIGAEERRVRAGAVIFIPRGAVHHYSNEGDDPTVALVVYAPPFDGHDREIVTATGPERLLEDDLFRAADAEAPGTALPGRVLPAPWPRPRRDPDRRCPRTASPKPRPARCSRDRPPRPDHPRRRNRTPRPSGRGVRACASGGARYSVFSTLLALFVSPSFS